MTNTKKYFKIELQSMEWGSIKEIAILAAYVNSGKETLNIDGLGLYAKIQLATFTPEHSP